MSHTRCRWVVERSPHAEVNVSFGTIVRVMAFHVDDELPRRVDSHVVPGWVVGTADAAIVEIGTFKLISGLRGGGSLKLD